MQLLQHSKSVFVCLLIGAAGLFIHAVPSPSAKAAQAVTLNGEAALAELKADGSYESLAEAISVLIPQQRRFTSNEPNDADDFGAAVALSGDTAAVGVPFADVEGENEGAVFVFVRAGQGPDTRWTLQQRVTANDAADFDLFGTTVALDGDTLAVGAIYADIGKTRNQGSVYVFTRSNAVWTQQARLTASDGARSDNFGSAIALHEGTLVVGVRFDDVGANEAQGSAYVFTREGSTWTERQRLNALEGKADEWFGASVAINRDVMVIGATSTDVANKENQGAAYVFERRNGYWSQRLQLLASDGAAGDGFGSAVAVSGEMVAVAASLNDFNESLIDQGAVYVYLRNLNAAPIWKEYQQILSPNGGRLDQFGHSLALEGGTLLIGAPGHSVGGNLHQGSAYLFAFNSEKLVWAPQRHLFAEGVQLESLYGSAVALSGNSMLVGAPKENGAAPQQGAAYVYEVREAMTTAVTPLTDGEGAMEDFFGNQLALQGDTLVIGINRDDVGANEDQGSVLVFRRNDKGWFQQQRIVARDGRRGDHFGAAVALYENTLVIGAPNHEAGTIMNQGAVYVFTRYNDEPETQWRPQQKLIAEDATAQESFGNAVAVSGNTILVGMQTDYEPGQIAHGSAYVFERTPITPGFVLQQKLLANDKTNGDFFGYSVALNGDTALIGAFNDTIGANTTQGSAYIFARSNGRWTQQQKLLASDGRTNDAFGSAVALSGDTALVGAPYHTPGTAAATGAAYVYTRKLVGALTQWQPQQKLVGAFLTTNARFGSSVALNGDTAVIGASGDSNGRGAAVLYLRRGTTWTLRNNLYANNHTGSLYFGADVALSEDSIAVGASGLTINNRTSQGGVFTYDSKRCVPATIAPETLPNTEVRDRFTETLTVRETKDSHWYSVANGMLPPGLNLSAGGVLSGVPSVGGTYRFTVKATHTETFCSTTRVYTLTVNQRPGCEAQVTPTLMGTPYNSTSNNFNVTVGAGCEWRAVSHDPWIIINPDQRGAGNSVVPVTFVSNSSTLPRHGTVAIAGRLIEVVQAGRAAFVSAASYSRGTAKESIATAFGNELAKTTAVANTQPLPTTLGGVSIAIFNEKTAPVYAPLFFVSPGQVNFQIPADLRLEKFTFMIYRDGIPQGSDNGGAETVAPGLFAANANGQGIASGLALRIKADGSQTYEPIARYDVEKNSFVAVPINLGPVSDRVFLVLFGTGFRYRSALNAVTATIGGGNAEALYAGAQGNFAGLDQLNLALPRNLAGRGEVEIKLTVDGKAANPLKVTIQ